HGNPDPAAPGDWYGRADDDHLGVEPVVERAPSGREVSRPVGGRQNRDLVAELPQLRCNAGYVLVDVVGLRPGEGRNEADSKAHFAESSACGFWPRRGLTPAFTG